MTEEGLCICSCVRGAPACFIKTPFILTQPPCCQVGGVEEYLARGPGFLFLFHPAVGPLWDVIAQKIRGGALAPGAELVLEVRSRDARAMHDVLHACSSFRLCLFNVMGDNL